MNAPGSDMRREGGCACGGLRYRVTGEPLFVHCCHCRWCQRETGSAFVINALIEAERVVILEGDAQAVMTPSESGQGQKIFRCPECRVAVWSVYGGMGDAVYFVRAGTLDEPAGIAPDIHIYTTSRLPWFELPAGVPAVPEYYRRSEYWPAESRERLRQLRARTQTA